MLSLEMLMHIAGLQIPKELTTEGREEPASMVPEERVRCCGLELDKGKHWLKGLSGMISWEKWWQLHSLDHLKLDWAKQCRICWRLQPCGGGQGQNGHVG